MGKAILAIVGRPNVGKSTLFNTLAGEKISIVEDHPGVTRDRIYADVTWLNHSFSMIDTGGIEMDSKDKMLKHMREQADIAIDTADVILFLVDVRQGLVDADFKVADMLDAVLELFDLEKIEEEEDDRPKIAIVGKPNAGKSSLINNLLGENRVIVSDVAGTTRDAIDTEIVYNGTEYVFIDTAGLRRKSKIKENIERYSIIRTVAAIERSDVVILMIDATEGVSEQDAKIAGIAHDRGRGLIIAVNKWDAIEKDNHTVKEYTKKVRDILSFVPYAEIIFISALTGQRTKKIFDMLETVIENHAMRIQTGVLNEILMEAVALQQPPSDKGKRLKLFYMTQVSTKPPTFVLFVNKKELMHFSYQRYIENRIRDTFGFMGTPIRIFIRERKEKE